MADRSWLLRRAVSEDREFLFALNEAAMRKHVEKIWGWDDEEQHAIFDGRFRPHDWWVIQVEGNDVGVLIFEDNTDELYLAEIQLAPEWQGRGIGSSVVGALMDDATAEGKPLTLRVLDVNDRARALYERLGFRPYKKVELRTYLRWDG